MPYVLGLEPAAYSRRCLTKAGQISILGNMPSLLDQGSTQEHVHKVNSISIDLGLNRNVFSGVCLHILVIFSPVLGNEFS